MTRPARTRTSSPLETEPGLSPGSPPAFNHQLAIVGRWVLDIILAIATLPFRFILQPVILFPACLLIAFIAVLAHTPTALNFLYGSLSTRIVQLFSFSTPSLAPITYFYCTLVGGPFFCANTTDQPPDVPVSKITRSVATSAKLASDIFESVIGLGDPLNLALHQADILELALAIQYSTALEGKEALASQLWELSDLTRDVKDQVIGLNSQGINTFSFVAHEFSRIQDLIDLVQSGHSTYTTQTVSHNLDLLFDHLSRELSRLLVQIEQSLPLAARAADLGTGVARQLLEERFKLLKTKESTPLWRKLLDQQSWGSKQLARDLALTSESVEGLKVTWKRLEDLRSVLVAYRNNVAFFKASLVGWHIADHQLSAEDEVFAMRHIIENFKQAVKDSKSKSRNTSKPVIDA
ncbi:hypothetical protein CROQUDRAFT_104511 [Cronartium quercuum f. sp. fusiforme G11]|uniref:Uncharacterized protein n=1 Tax=Cronartium quercuum f. sp. fusiforme G11 TaxID=708437 RepID=A0A9P6NVG8_9BASI|nr:hypothetical protein CROQUDRAFT_104511 [Cronartium quercuum f. sp. fusiforme G11]